ncbi:MAG: HD domain-containing protein [Acidobacteriota bacterium]|nr:HD domain-containing protein [Acidobacteriota bacterium]
MREPALANVTAKRRYVADLETGESVDAVFLLSEHHPGKTKNDDPYLRTKFSDKSGTIAGIMWADSGAEAAASNTKEGDHVRVVGIVDDYQSKLQIKVTLLERVNSDSIDPGVFLPATECDVDEMCDAFLGIIGSIQNTYLRTLLQSTFEEPEVARLFRRAPAGIKLHHAYVGGLLEHTLSVATLANLLADHYDSVDRDLLVAGACLHDLGKIWELAYDKAFKYTEEGRLVGHLILESNWLAQRMDEIEGFPGPLRSHVLHLLASHHGRLEHGAPVQPATREALVLHYIDDLEAKMGAMNIAIGEAEANNDDAAYSRSLGRWVVKRRWNEVEE